MSTVVPNVARNLNCSCVRPRNRPLPPAPGAAAPGCRRLSRCLESVGQAGAAGRAPPLVAPAPSEGWVTRRPWASGKGEEMQLTDSSGKADLLRRVRRIEGQARGVACMIEEDRDCHEILQQLAAIRSAAHQATVALVRVYATECMASDGSPEEIADALATALSRLA